ncbi:MAG: hypothetical protein O3A14_06110 [Cyanobacteria bacterium]|nr:hypothetical protein [Cyanobacteriota bacterium]
MPPSAGDQGLPLTTDNGADRHSEASGQADLGLELSQIYALIDSILPFEACLYYQVLPLMIEGSRLVMGMVNPHDQAAEQYMKRQLAFINYSITTRTVSSEWHRDLLSKYLSHTAKTRQQPPPPSPSPPATPSTQPKPAAPVSAASHPEIGTNPTFVVDQPDQLEEAAPIAHQPKRSQVPPSPPRPPNPASKPPPQR